MEKIEEYINLYIEEWIKGMPPADATIEWYSQLLQSGREGVWLEKAIGPTSFISLVGNQALNTAADLLLKETGEQRRVSLSSSRKALFDAHEEHLSKAIKKGRVSEHAIKRIAIKNILHVARSSGSYVLPLVLSPMANKTDFVFGPVRIVSSKIFNSLHYEALNRQSDNENEKWILEKWSEYSGKYEHFIIVEVNNHEFKKARVSSREAAEIVLNTIRMFFGFSHTRNIRIGDGFIWEMDRASVFFNKQGDACISHASGPWGAILEEGWEKVLWGELGHHSEIIAGLASWIVSGDDAISLIMERLRYASTLIAEAYSEPYDHIRLVRLISALEALSLIENKDKAHNLALHCSWAGGWGEPDIANEIYDSIRSAYMIRSKIVHGDSATTSDILKAFYPIEKNLLRIWLGVLYIYLGILKENNPNSIKILRRMFKGRVEDFYWGIGD